MAQCQSLTWVRCSAEELVIYTNQFRTLVKVGDATCRKAEWPTVSNSDSEMTTLNLALNLEVTCISKTDRYNPHERIRGIGGYALGTRWYLTQEQAITAIETGQHQFFVRANGRVVRVIVAVSRYGHKYLKTETDGEQTNNLLSLPECP